MRAGTMESNFSGFEVNLINQQPVGFHMTFKTAFQFTVQGVVSAFRRQMDLTNNHAHYFNKFIHIFTTLFCKSEFFFKFACVNSSKHILTPQICQQFLKGIKPLSRDLSTHHSSAFLNGGNGFGVKARLPRYGVAARGADGTFFPFLKPGVISFTGFFLFDMLHKVKYLRSMVFGQSFDFFDKQFGNRHFKPPVVLSIA
jgi:hypothetical protein